MQSIQDDRVLDALEEIGSKENTHVWICSANTEAHHHIRAQRPYLDWYMQKKPYLHAKVILRDGKYAYIGSHNLTTNSLDNNRELGVFLALSEEQYHSLREDAYK